MTVCDSLDTFATGLDRFVDVAIEERGHGSDIHANLRQDSIGGPVPAKEKVKKVAQLQPVAQRKQDTQSHCSSILPPNHNRNELPTE